MIQSVSQRENTLGFYIERLDLNVYSYEGFCYYMFQEPGAFHDIISEGACLEWIRDGLKLREIYDQLKSYFEEQHTSLSRMVKLLSMSPYSRQLDQTLLEERYEVFIKTPLYIRYKETGNLHFRKGDFSSALSWYKSACALEKDSQVYNNMGLVYTNYNELSKAHKMFTKALEIEESLPIRLNRLKLLIAMEDLDQAMSELDEISDLSMDWQVWYYYGAVHEQLGHGFEALGAYLRSYELSRSLKALEKLVFFEAKYQSVDTAFRYVEEAAIALEQKEYLRAQIYRAQKAMGQYEQSMEISIKYAKNTTPLLLELALYYVDQSQVIRGVECIGMIEKIDQNLESVVSTKAIIASKAGNSREMDMHVSALLANWKQEVRSAVAK